MAESAFLRIEFGIGIQYAAGFEKTGFSAKPKQIHEDVPSSHIQLICG